MSKAPDFTELTGLDIIKIDICNTFGNDKLLYEERLAWFEKNKGAMRFDPNSLISIAKEPMLFHKGLLAYDSAIRGEAIGHNVFMDATASGLQIMAALSNCKKTAEACNLIFNGQRNDLYDMVAEEMQKRLPNSEMFKDKSVEEIRDIVKKPIMTFFYNSTAQPEEVFGEDTIEIKTFIKTLEDMFPGAIAVMQFINESWNPNAMYHQWTLPDEHIAHVKVIDKVSTKVDVDELDFTFNYHFYTNQPSESYRSLAPNIIHSIDGWIVREMVRRAKAQGFQLAHIHDAFTCHPNHMTKAMDNYRQILAELSEMNLLNTILTEIDGKPAGITPFKYNLAFDIRVSQYALC